MKKLLAILFSVLILDRLLAGLFFYPLPIFSLTGIMFLIRPPVHFLRSTVMKAILPISLFSDSFSGWDFGWPTLVLVAVALSVILTARGLFLENNSWFTILAIFLAFVSEYLFLLSLPLSIKYALGQLPATLAEAAIVGSTLNFLFLKNPKSVPDNHG